MTNHFAGIILAILTLLVLIGRRTPEVEFLLTALLIVIAAIYIGFAIKDGGQKALVTETLVAIVFVGIALSGYFLSPYFLVFGYIAHGFWDFAHAPQRIPTRIPTWYPAFCAVYDWIVGLYAFLRLCL